MTPRRVILLGDKTLSGIERLLNHQLEQRQLSWRVKDAGFDSWLREIADPASATSRDDAAALGFLLSPRVLDSPHAPTSIETVLDTLERRASSRTVLFSNLFPDPLGPMPLTRHAAVMETAATINSTLYAFSRTHPWFHVVDQAGLALREGTRTLTDARFEATAQMYFSPSGAKRVADLWLRLLRALEKPAAKVLVVDLDNTLWRGILGEDGPEGIDMSPGARGWAHRRLQLALLELKANGVLLAISSKNNPDEAVRLLAEHPDCLLRPHDFSAIEIGWGPKSDSLRRMAHRLRLGLDAFVFLDDSPVEREEVRKTLPQVEVLEFPDDPLALVEALSGSFAFDSPRITNEDRERSTSYAAEARRDALRDTGASPEQFYRSLSLQLTLFRGRAIHAVRLHQLLLKTNQFNLTADRLTADAFTGLMENADALVVGMRVADRFGDSGVTGLAIVTGIRSSTWTVEHFLLSCRVIGRTIEHAFVSWLMAQAGKAGAADIAFRFRSTARNQAAREFLERSGLSWNESAQVWGASTAGDQPALAPHFVAIDDRGMDLPSTPAASRGSVDAI